MKSQSIHRSSICSILAAAALCLGAMALVRPANAAKGKAQNIYAQKLADEFPLQNFDVITIGIHVTPPGSTESVIIAHTLHGHVGGKSDESDVSPIKTGKAVGPEAYGGGVYETVVRLCDASGTVIGVLNIHVKPKPGGSDPTAEALELSNKYADLLAKEIPSKAKLFEPL